MFSTFNSVFKLIRVLAVIIIGTLITVFSVSIPYFALNSPSLYIPFIILGVIIGTVVGSYVYVILSIPFELPQKFDSIKNKVADGKYANINELQNEIASFTISFFNFIGADIVGGKFHFKNCNPKIIECGVSFNLVKEDVEFKKIKIDSYHSSFFVPIKFGEKDLGYMVLIAKGFTIPLLPSILQDYENYYLDDQILHLVNN